MKIVSNFKDFYDFIYGHDTDQTNVYVRKQEYLTFTPDEYLQSGIGSYVRKHCLGIYTYDSANNYMMGSVLLGIYPNVYVLNVAVPSLFDISVHGPSITCDPDQRAYVIPTNLLPDKSKISEIFGINLASSPYHYTNDGRVRISHIYSMHHSGGDMVNSVFEDQEIFKKIGAPIFVGPISEGGYDYDRNCTISATFIKNPNLGELNKAIVGMLNMVRELDPNFDVTVYDRIENYLYSSKVEPVSEPDNKTKILNAGFDLKTSFRKM